MIYPVGDGTKETFYRDWYIADYFGSNRGHYFHSGDDLNLKTGGDSDLGQPLLACADGEVTGTDTVSTTGFGKQIFIAFDIGGVVYYAHYAHCQTIDVRPGERVKSGQIIGKLGKSGTKYAHLHFSIKNTANGMDNVPNTKEELKQWEDPIKFIEKYYTDPTKPTPKPEPDPGCLVPNTEEGQKTYEKLVTNSEKADKVVVYLGLGDNADDVSYETIEKSLAARIGNADANKSKAQALEQEIENRKEQISRLKKRLQDTKQLHEDLETKQKQTHKITEAKYESTISTLTARIEVLEKRVDEVNADKGKILRDKADVQARLDQCQKGYVSPSLLTKIINLLTKKS